MGGVQGDIVTKYALRAACISIFRVKVFEEMNGISQHNVWGTAGSLREGALHGNPG